MEQGKNGYSTQSLKDSTIAIEKNIETFEIAIITERETIKSYRVMIDQIRGGDLSCGFNIDSLKGGIESSEKNIKTFEETIKKERDQIKENQFMIETIHRKEKEAEVTNVTIDASTFGK